MWLVEHNLRHYPAAVLRAIICGMYYICNQYNFAEHVA